MPYAVVSRVPTFCSTLRPLPPSSPTLPRRCHSSRRSPPHTSLRPPAAHALGREHWPLPGPYLPGCWDVQRFVREALSPNEEECHCQRCRKKLYNVYVTRRPPSGHTPPPTNNSCGPATLSSPLYHLAYSLRPLQATAVPGSHLKFLLPAHYVPTESGSTQASTATLLC